MPGHFTGVPGHFRTELKWPDTRASSFGVSDHFVTPDHTPRLARLGSAQIWEFRRATSRRGFQKQLSTTQQ